MKKLLFILPLMLIMASCTFFTRDFGEENEEDLQNKEVYGNNEQNYGVFPHRLIVDTITIHGKSHEVIMFANESYATLGGMMHSPECWCKKDSVSKSQPTIASTTVTAEIKDTIININKTDTIKL